MTKEVPTDPPEDENENHLPPVNDDGEKLDGDQEKDDQTRAGLNFGSISVLIPPSKAGNSRSRDELFAELQSYLEFAANRHMDRSLKHKAGASDIVQESFIQIIENFDKFRGTTSAELRGWINKIVANEMNGVRRKFRTAKRDFTQEKQIDPKSSTSPGNVPADGNLTPSSDAMQAERKQKFHETLEMLSDEHAEVIRLRNIERLAFKEIGDKMGRTENAVSKLWYRAILQFEEKLKGQTAFQDDFSNEPKSDEP